MQDADTMHQTQIGSVVIYDTPTGLQAYSYGGQIAFDLMRVPENQRAAAREGFAKKLGINEISLDRMLTLSPLSWPGHRATSRQPIFADRALVYPYEEALKKDEAAVLALNIPPMVTKPRKIVSVTQVPIEIYRTPEYQSELARKKTETEAIAIALSFALLAESRKSTGTGQRNCYNIPPYGTTGVTVEHCTD